MELPIQNRQEGERVLVDPEDFDELMQYKWAIRRTRRDGYTVKYVFRWWTHSLKPYRQRYEQLHRHIVGAPMADPATSRQGHVPGGVVVDHINGDTLDNRRSNLRICTVSENLMNRHR